MWGRARMKWWGQQGFLSLYEHILFHAISGGSSMHIIVGEKTLQIWQQPGLDGWRKPLHLSHICWISGTFLLPGDQGEGTQDSVLTPLQVLELWEVINLLCRTVTKPNRFYFPYLSPSHSSFPIYYMPLKDRDGVWLCSHGLMYSARHVVPRVYGMTHTLTWRSRRLW